MAFQDKDNLISWILIFAVLLFLIEVTFFDGGYLFSLGIAAFLLYYGKKKFHKYRGKLAVFSGAVIVIVSILNMFAFKLLLLSLLGLFIYKFIKSKKHPAVFTPDFSQAETEVQTEKIKSKPLLFGNKVLGGQKTPDHIYDWEDINIQNGVGDIVIDLGSTLLPKGESVISARNIAGTIKIYVPYEVDVKIVHSIVAGSVHILGHDEQKMFNRNMTFFTENYEHSPYKIKIITSIVAGSLEVIRV